MNEEREFSGDIWKTVTENQREIIKLKNTIPEITNLLNNINRRLMQQNKRLVNFR